MNRNKIGIFLSLLLALGLTGCKEHKSSSKLVINEVLITNEHNFQDDYGEHNAWVEIFNRSYGSSNLAACLLFHTNFTLKADADNWIGLFDAGNNLLDALVVPAGTLGADESYARVNDGSDEWEVKGGSDDKYVTPCTNNQTIDSNAKMEKFQLHDSIGIGMSITAMSVVFVGLILLYISFRFIGKASVALSRRRAMAVKGITDKQEAKEKKLGEAHGEVFAAIALAMHEMQSDVHDVEDTVLTITRVKRSYSPWSSKIYTLRETPHKK